MRGCHVKVIAFVFLAFGPLGLLGKEEACEGQHCQEADDAAASALLQSRKHLGQTSIDDMSDEKETVLYRLVLKGFECGSRDRNMGTKASPQECADAVKAAGGHFFDFGTGRKAGRCYMENTATVACTEGFRYYPSYDFYALETPEERAARGEEKPALYRLVKGGHACRSRDRNMGTRASLQECADVVKAAGGHFFDFGTGRKAGRCYMENTATAACTEGFQWYPSYDFFALETAEERAVGGGEKPALYRLVLTSFECRSRDRNLGTKASPQECADAVKAAGGHFFDFGTGHNAGKCYVEDTATAACTEGFKYHSTYDFYALETAEERAARGEEKPALYRLVKQGHECRSRDESMGTRASPQECADVVKVFGGHFFDFGTGAKAGRCYMENTASAACTEGFKYYPSYDFYALETAEERAAREKAEKEAADAARKKAYEEWAKRGKIEPTPETVSNAQFLIQATFGPTRKSLKELDGINYEDWIENQMALPASSHREYYRARVSPVYSDAYVDHQRFTKTAPCSKGSRWHNFVFTKAHEGTYSSRWLPVVKQRVTTIAGQILIENVVKSDIDSSDTAHTCTDEPSPWFKDKGKTCTSDIALTKRNCGSNDFNDNGYCRQTCYDIGVRIGQDDCSAGWAKYGTENIDAYLCSIEEYVGGYLKLSKDESCETGLFYMSNPPIALADSKAPDMKWDFETNPITPGVIFLKESQTSCTLSSPDPIITHDGKRFQYEPRMALAENTLDNPQTLSKTWCPQRTFLNEKSCRLQAPHTGGCDVACGSPGEVATDPVKGNMYEMKTKFIFGIRGKTRDFELSDLNLDTDFANGKQITRTTVWTMQALESEDQLRQRTAWALSQILVVGWSGISDGDMYTEMWMAYYDIFVRHAFGNYRDVLREVTFSPMMGQYLTYVDSTCFDWGRRYPDENYARELMQLFTMGVNKLNHDGSLALEDGLEVAAYTNADIMTYARLFTGFKRVPQRGNVEHAWGNWGSKIDPMWINPKYHDKYPKSSLDGGFLGDGYPLCSDLPQRAFLKQGARYEFVGYEYSGDVSLKLGAADGSGLFNALKDFAVTITLNADISCSGKECKLEKVDVVQVGTGFYEYIAPTCVHLFIGNLVMTTRAWSPDSTRWHTCFDPLTPAAGFSCCKGCTDTPHRFFAKLNWTCQDAKNKWLDRRTNEPIMFSRMCAKDRFWASRKYCAHTCFKNNADYGNELAYPGVDCSGGDYVEDITKCQSMDELSTLSAAQAYCKEKGLRVCGSTENRFDCKGGTWMRLWTEKPCPVPIQVHADGKISANTEYHAENSFAVTWDGGRHPGAGTYDANVTVTPVFTSVPTKEELLAELKVGAFAPRSECTHSCDSGEVKAYATSADVIDELTIFEYKGRFFKNARSVVHVNGFSFRNPPSFMPQSFTGHSTRALTRAAIAEVESHIDQVFHHPNTPVNIGKKLIQRFTSSNPSPAYIKAVANAFQTGAFKGKRFSGKYGDLGATIAAILLHEEARTQDGNSNGLLREPMIKLIHVMRSMEYVEATNDNVVFRRLEDIGQFPYHSPSVFNYYTADFMPDTSSFRRHLNEPGKSDKPTQEPEPEPEPEPLTAPEFEIFTAPYAINLLNGMNQLVENGLSSCWGGLGSRLGSCDPRGRLEHKEAPTVGETVEEMNVLLTGGRLTPLAKKIVTEKYTSADEGKKLQAAQNAILFTPEFSTLGNQSVIGTHPPRPKKSEHTPKNYKAVVFMFLGGGADTFNMLVPRDCALHEEYAAARKGIEIPISKLLPIEAATQKCKNFGINPAMKHLHQLYKDKEAAFVSNVGTLLEPTTLEQLKGGAVKRCPSQFSHSHAAGFSMTLQCHSAAKAPHGIGGLMADDVAKKNFKSESFSMAGMSKWSPGKDTHIQILSGRGAAARLAEYDEWHHAIANFSSQKHKNVYSDNFGQELHLAVESSEDLGKLLDGLKSGSLVKYKANLTSMLSHQLYQVSRLIALRGQRKAERDFFFVSRGGWDMHSGLVDGLQDALTEVDEAIAGFVGELKAQGVFDSVVLTTSSDFGRTLSFNGKGTDHGWAGNHIVVGGGINGGQIYNDFLKSYTLGGAYDDGRGRVIPEYPWESMYVPIAQWVGVDDVEGLFKNLGKFNRSHHIISRDALFKSEQQ